KVVGEIHSIQDAARQGGQSELPAWPMIVLRTPKGWTGPTVVDGKPVENTWRAHQVPVTDFQAHPEHLKILEDWMKSYQPQELFDDQGKLVVVLAELAPKGEQRMSANPHANGGLLLKDLNIPDFREYALDISKPGNQTAESTRVLGKMLRDMMRQNADSANFRVFGPDETASNRLEALYEATSKIFMEPILSTDIDLSRDGRVMEVLSEHLCQG